MKRIGQALILLSLLLGLWGWIGLQQNKARARFLLPTPAFQAPGLAPLTQTQPLTHTVFIPFVAKPGGPATLTFVSSETIPHPSCAPPASAYLITFSYSDDGDFPFQTPSPVQVGLHFNDSAQTTQSFAVPQPHVTGDGFSGQVWIAICLDFMTEATAVEATISTAGGTFTTTLRNGN